MIATFARLVTAVVGLIVLVHATSFVAAYQQSNRSSFEKVVDSVEDAVVGKTVGEKVWEDMARTGENWSNYLASEAGGDLDEVRDMIVENGQSATESGRDAILSYLEEHFDWKPAPPAVPDNF